MLSAKRLILCIMFNEDPNQRQHINNIITSENDAVVNLEAGPARLLADDSVFFYFLQDA